MNLILQTGPIGLIIQLSKFLLQLLFGKPRDHMDIWRAYAMLSTRLAVNDQSLRIAGWYAKLYRLRMLSYADTVERMTRALTRQAGRL